MKKPFILSLFFWIFSTTGNAELLQIIHVNDLHSHFEYADTKEFGGYAAILSTINEIRERAKTAGIESLTLNAGDFTEGNIFYFSDFGQTSWNVVNQMGFDAVTIGNHDWYMGLDELDRMVEKTNPNYQLLGANFIFDNKHPTLQKRVVPFARFEKGTKKIAVLGITTDSLLWRWRAAGATLNPPTDVAKSLLDRLLRENDAVIVLSHLGLEDDTSLVSETRGIDVVVGGHSHTTLYEPLFIKNKNKQLIPIVQAGSYGKYVGDLLIDIERGQPVKIIHYKLVPVVKDHVRDPLLNQIVQDARSSLEDRFGAGWLHEEIGRSEFPLIPQTSDPTIWSQFAVDSFREAISTDIALDQGEFSGVEQPAGPLTRENLFMLYPRVFDIYAPYGWTLWRAKIYGCVLEMILNKRVSNNLAISVSGVTYEVKGRGKDAKAANIRIGGERLQLWKKYSISLPEGLTLGTIGITELSRKFLIDPEDTLVPTWQALTEKLQRDHVIR